MGRAANNAVPCFETCRSGLVVAVLCRPQRVAHQRGDGHRPDAARHRCYECAFGCYMLKIDVAFECVARLFGGVGCAGDAHINDDGALFHHVGGNEVRLPECGNQNVGCAANLLDVARVAVAQRYGSVSRVGFAR